MRVRGGQIRRWAACLNQAPTVAGQRREMVTSLFLSLSLPSFMDLSFRVVHRSIIVVLAVFGGQGVEQTPQAGLAIEVQAVPEFRHRAAPELAGRLGEDQAGTRGLAGSFRSPPRRSAMPVGLKRPPRRLLTRRTQASVGLRRHAGLFLIVGRLVGGQAQVPQSIYTGAVYLLFPPLCQLAAGHHRLQGVSDLPPGVEQDPADGIDRLAAVLGLRGTIAGKLGQILDLPDLLDARGLLQHALGLGDQGNLGAARACASEERSRHFDLRGPRQVPAGVRSSVTLSFFARLALPDWTTRLMTLGFFTVRLLVRRPTMQAAYCGI